MDAPTINKNYSSVKNINTSILVPKKFTKTVRPKKPKRLTDQQTAAKDQKIAQILMSSYEKNVKLDSIAFV